MPSNKSIRVVKRDQRDVLQKHQQDADGEVQSDRQARRLMLQTITSWIEEQRELKKQLARHWILVEERAD